MSIKKKKCITIELHVNTYLYHIILALSFISNIKGTLRYLFARAAFYSVLFLSGFVCIPFFLLSPRNLKNSVFYARHIGKHTTRLFGITWEIRGGNNVTQVKSAVIVANHQHEMDIIGMLTIWPILDKCAAVAKKELLWSPFGLAAWLAGVVFINRKDTRSAKKKINEKSKILNENMKIFMFPEGTRNSQINCTKQLLNFKKGAFRIAIQSQVPIIPIVFSRYYFIDDDQRILDKGGKVIISILPPISTKGLGLEDTEVLSRLVRNRMQREYNALDEEIQEFNDVG